MSSDRLADQLEAVVNDGFPVGQTAASREGALRRDVSANTTSATSSIAAAAKPRRLTETSVMVAAPSVAPNAVPR